MDRTNGRAWLPRASFQTKLFLAAFSSALLALVVAGVIVSLTLRRDTTTRVEQTLTAEARLAAALIESSRTAAGAAQARDLDDEADRIGALVTARVTLIDANGVVVGDSAEPLDALGGMENHAARPEVADARSLGVGVARRSSATLNEDMLYVAVPLKPIA